MQQNKYLLVYITANDGFGKQALFAVDLAVTNYTTMITVQENI